MRDAEDPPREIELKFRLPPGAAAALDAHPVLELGAVPAKRDLTTYFDTPGRDLARAGAVLRLRGPSEGAGAERVQTLKLRAEGDGPFARGEWEWRIRAEEPDLSLLATTPLAPLLPGLAPLVPVFTTEVARRSRLLHPGGPDGIAEVEVCLDQGHVRAGEAEEPIEELELELRAGEPAALYRLAAALRADLPLTLDAEAKSDRGWRLSTGLPRAPEEQPRTDFPDDIPAGEALRRVLDATLGNLLANQPAALAGSAEGVHRMRIATRRLRAALALFRPLLEEATEARFRAELGHLGRVLGAARDWDVFLAETLPEAGLPPGQAAPLRAAAEAERRTAQAALEEEFRQPGFTTLVLDLAAWAETLPGSLDQPLAKAAPKLAARLDRQVRRRGKGLKRRGAEELHALRKSLKRLRYGVEILAPLHRPKRVRRHLRGCKALQERLGTINDAAVAVTLARRLGAERPDLAPAIAALGDWAAARQARAQRRLPEAWRAFKDLPLPG